MLVLTERLLVEGVRLLELVARQKQVHVERIFGRETVVETVEEVEGRAAIMQHGEFRRVEKTTRPVEVEVEEVARFGIAEGERRFLIDRAERAVGKVDVAGRLLLIQAGLGDR